MYNYNYIFIVSSRFFKFVIEEMNQELELIKNGHPNYKPDDFITSNDYNFWKTAKMLSIERKIKVMENVKHLSGHLNICIIDCENLGDGSIQDDKMNVYFILKVQNQELESTIKSGSKNPAVDERFDFEINSFETKIKIEVWNKKFIGSTFLGCISLSLTDIMWEKMPYVKSYYLEPMPNSSSTIISGSIKLAYNLKFRIGPSPFESRSTENKKENAFSQLFRNSKQDSLSAPRPRIENIKVEECHDYFRYLILIILLDAYETEVKRLENIPQEDYTNQSKPSGFSMLTHKKAKPIIKYTYDPVTPSRELQWIILNFKLRFNISDTFEHLVALEALIYSFRISCDHLTMIHFTLLELAASKLTDRLLWKRESQKYDQLVIMELKSELDDVLSNYFVRVPENKPEGALSIVIALYCLMCDPARLTQVIYEKAESSMIRMYKTVVGERPSESSLIDASKFVFEIIELEDRYYNNVFPAENNHTMHCLNIYYSEMLSKNVKSLLRTSPPISENIMTLYQQLKKLNQKILKFNPQIEVLPLSQIFQPFVSKWIEKVGDQLPSWCERVLKKESWKALSLDENNPALHSQSIQELFDIIYEIYSTYRDFEMRTSKDLKNLQKIIDTTIRTYVHGIMSSANAEMGSIYSTSALTVSDKSNALIYDNPVVSKNNREDVSTVGKILPIHMTWIMNLEAITKKLYAFCTQLEVDGEKGADNSKEAFSDVFSIINDAEQQLIYHILCKFNQNRELEASFEVFLGNPPDASKISTNDIVERMTPLFDYINSSVKILCENLDFKVCLRVIEKLWGCLVEDLNLLLYPSIPSRKFSAKAVNLVERSYPFLIEFFNANGDGLPVQLLEKVFLPIENALDMSKLPTNQLIKMHVDLKNGLKPQGSTFINQKHLEIHIIAVLGSRKGDKEARKFSKANREETISKAVIKSFGLPSTESLIDWYTCFKDKDNDVPGYFYLTTSFVCFNTLLPIGHLVKIQLSTIKDIKRRKNTLCSFYIHLNSGLSVYFHTFSKNKVYDSIVEQADKLGIKIEIIDKQKPPEPEVKESRRHRGYSLSEFDKRSNTSLVNIEESTSKGSDNGRLLKRISSSKLKKEKRKSHRE